MADDNLAVRRFDNDPLLGGFAATAYQKRDVFLARNTVPTVRVTSADFTGNVHSLPIAALLGDATLVGTGRMKVGLHGEAPESTSIEPVKTAYECEISAHKFRLNKLEMARSQNYQTERVKMHRAMRTMLLDEEKELVTTLFATGTWTNAAIGALTGGTGTAWDTAGSTPIKDGLAVQNLIRAASGVEADVGYISHDILESLRIHQETRRVIGDIADGVAQTNYMAESDDDVLEFYRRAWRLRRLHVVGAVQNSAAPGQTASVAELSTGKLWFGCFRGAEETTMAEDRVVDVMGGPISLLRIDEALDDETAAVATGMQYPNSGLDLNPFAVEEWEVNDPKRRYIKLGRSSDLIVPSGMTATAYLVTGVVS